LWQFHERGIIVSSTGARAPSSVRPAGIGVDERQRVDGVLEATEPATSLAELLETTLAGLDVHFGYSRSAFNGSWCPT